MYDLTGSTFAVAMIAVAGLLPMIVAGLYGGMLADAFDRRLVALIAATVTFASTVAARRARLGAAGRRSWWLYVLSVVNSAANTIVMAARQAIVPRLIPRDLLPAASALNGITVGIMVMAGPALAGVLVAFTGYAWTYTIDVVLMLSLFLGLWTLPSIRPEGEIVRPGLESLRDGWRFLKRASNIRLQFILDIIAMTFGQPLALFPAIGAVLLGGGPITTGALTASDRGRRVPLEPVLGSGRSRAAPRARHRAGDPRLRRRRSPRSGSCSARRRSAGSRPPTVDATHAEPRAHRRGRADPRRRRRRRQRQLDLPQHDGAGRRARRDPRPPAGRLHRRGRGRTAARRALRRHARDLHRRCGSRRCSAGSSSSGSSRCWCG